MLSYALAPTPDGKSSSCADNEQKVRLWAQAADVEPPSRASSLTLQMDTFARQECINAGGETLMQGRDVESILNTSRKYLQSDSSGRNYRQATKFRQYNRAD